MISIGNDALPAMWAAAIRLALAAPLLALIAAATGVRRPRGRALIAAAGFGFFNLGVAFALLYWAEKRVASGLSAVVFATIPLTSTFISRALGLERLNAGKVGAAAVALAGVGVIFSGQLRAGAEPLPLLALFVAATSAALGVALLKRGPAQNPFGSNAVGCMVGFAVCLAGSFLAGEPHPLPTTAGAWFPILYLTLAGSIGAYVLMAWLVNHWDVTRISFIAVIVPLVALVLGNVFRGERLTGTSLAGSALVLAGVLLRIRSDRLARGKEPPGH